MQIKSAKQKAEKERREDKDGKSGKEQFFLPERFPDNKIYNKDRACIIAEREQISGFIPGDQFLFQ